MQKPADHSLIFTMMATLPPTTAAEVTIPPTSSDYLNADLNPTIRRIFEKTGDTRCVFSDIVVKINKRNKMQERMIVLTGRSFSSIRNSHSIDYTSILISSMLQNTPYII